MATMAAAAISDCQKKTSPRINSVVTPTEIEKMQLVEDPDLPFFTIDHFRNFNAVLVQESRLGEIDVDELREIITDAWLTRAPKRLAREFRAERDG